MRGFEILFFFLITGSLAEGLAYIKENKNIPRVYLEVKDILYQGDDNYNIKISLRIDSSFLIIDDMDFSVYVQAANTGQWIPVKILFNETLSDGLQKEIFIAVHIPIEKIKGIYKNFEGDISIRLIYKMSGIKTTKINHGEILIWLKPRTNIWVQREGM